MRAQGCGRESAQSCDFNANLYYISITFEMALILKYFERKVITDLPGATDDLVLLKEPNPLARGRPSASVRSLVCDAARRLGAAVQSVRRRLPQSTTSSPMGSAELPPAAAESAALRQQLKAVSTAVRLDSSAATAMLHEAVHLSAPILCYVALGDC